MNAALRFARIFQRWGIEIPAEDIAARRTGRIHSQGWNIAYVFGRSDSEEYLEFYAMHRMTDDRHLRLWEDGRDESLQALADGFVSNPNVPGDAQRNRARYFANNARIRQEMIDQNLWPGDTISSYMHTTPSRKDQRAADERDGGKGHSS